MCREDLGHLLEQHPPVGPADAADCESGELEELALFVSGMRFASRRTHHWQR